MADLNKQKDELLEAVKAPKRKKTPTNNSLYFALIAADVIFGILDIGSGITVYWMTGIWFYGVLVFLAGFAPLILFQKLYTRAFASDEQKKIAIGGAALAVFSIIAIGILSAVANVKGVTNQSAELTVLVTVVALAFVHALLLTAYFYIDEGIQADQTVAQTLAEAIRQETMIEAGDQVLGVAQRALKRRKQIADFHGSPAALKEVLKRLGWDEDGDGVPDWMDPVDNRTGKPFQQTAARTFAADGQNVTPPADPTNRQDQK